MDASYLLTREINYIRGPQGQIVVVVQPNQTKLELMEEATEDVCCTICTVFSGLLGFPFAIIGFSLMCVGWVEDVSAAGLIGLIFFIIGLVFVVFFIISICCLRKNNKDRVQKYMYRSDQGEEEDTQPMLTEDFGRELSPYQRFMMYRGVQQASSDMNISGHRLTPSQHISDQRSTSAQDVSWRLQPSAASLAMPEPMFTTAGQSFDGNSINLPRNHANSYRISEYPGNRASSPQAPTYVGTLPEYRRSATGHDYSSPGQFSSQTLQDSITHPSSERLPFVQSPTIQPSASQTSLDHILGNVIALSSSLDPERNETRTTPVQAPTFNSNPSGRRSPYENF